MSAVTYNEELAAVDTIRALIRGRNYLPDQTTARQLITQLSVMLGMPENEMLIRMAAYHDRNKEMLSNMLLEIV